MEAGGAVPAVGPEEEEAEAAAAREAEARLCESLGWRLLRFSLSLSLSSHSLSHDPAVFPPPPLPPPFFAPSLEREREEKR